jgi:hypothetical protein
MLEQAAGKTLTFIKVPKRVELNAIGRVLLLGPDPRKPINPCMHSSRRKFPKTRHSYRHNHLFAPQSQRFRPSNCRQRTMVARLVWKDYPMRLRQALQSLHPMFVKMRWNFSPAFARRSSESQMTIHMQLQNIGCDLSGEIQLSS